MKGGLYQLAVVIALLAVGCSNGTDSGEIFSPESGHRANWVDPAFIGTAEFHGSAVQVGGSTPTTVQIDATVCMLCHGDDLDGGIANVSCFACHNGPTGAVGHPTTWLLKEDPTHFHGRYASNYAIACTACHAEDLTGGIGPSCFRCHDPEELQDVLEDVRDSAG